MLVLPSGDNLYEAFTWTRSPSATPFFKAALITCFLISFCKYIARRVTNKEKDEKALVSMWLYTCVYCRRVGCVSMSESNRIEVRSLCCSRLSPFRNDPRIEKCDPPSHQQEGTNVDQTSCASSDGSSLTIRAGRRGGVEVLDTQRDAVPLSPT